MAGVIASSWAILLGVLLLMVGNGIQGTLLGVRGEIEGFSTGQMSVIMSAYFAGFLVASRLVPKMLQRVGHVRVFAALGGLICAALLLFPVLTTPWAWTGLRVVIGFCFCGVYITAESWLNNAVSNENRGKALSLYMLAQMVGIILAQLILANGDPSGYLLFILIAVLVSVSFAPVLLTVAPAPEFAAIRPLKLRELFAISPLTVVGVFLLGGVFAAQFGMSGVWGTKAGLSLRQLSVFVVMVYVGGLLSQYPLGWISDRMDRRRLIVILAFAGAGGGLIGSLAGDSYPLLLLSGFILGGMANPLYAMLLAYANDYMDRSQMPAASAGFLFVNGLGAIFGPILTGWMMDRLGLWAYFFFMGLLMFLLALYALWRITRRDRSGITEGAAFVPVPPSVTLVGAEAAQELGIERAGAQASGQGPGQPQG